MNNDALLAQPLTETEIKQLDDFLIGDSAPNRAMNVSMMDGFMTALASAPNPMMPSLMLRWIWDSEHGKNDPPFARLDEPERIVCLIVRYWNALNLTLNHRPHAYTPRVLERECNDGGMSPIIDKWCIGYCKGIAVDQAAWSPLLAQCPEWFTTILLYGTETGREEVKRRNDSLYQQQACADSLAGSARHIHRVWMQQQGRQIVHGKTRSVIAQHPLLRSATEAVNDVLNAGYLFDWVPTRGFASTNDAPSRSTLCQQVIRDGMVVKIEISKNGESGWLLEIVDEFGNLTVWADVFPTDSAALAEALNTIDNEGITSMIGNAPASTIRH